MTAMVKGSRQAASPLPVAMLIWAIPFPDKASNPVWKQG
jgi:hypothetical protein